MRLPVALLISAVLALGATSAITNRVDEPTVYKLGPGKTKTVDLPPIDPGRVYLVSAFAPGSRPDKGPLQAPGWDKLGQTLHLARFWHDAGPSQITVSTTSTNVAGWVIVVQDFAAAPTDHVGSPSCALNGDPICGGGKGTPGVINAPAIPVPAGGIVSSVWAAHDNAISIDPPDQAVTDVIIWADAAIVVSEHVASGSEDAPAKATTQVPNYIRALAERTVIP